MILCSTDAIGEFTFMKEPIGILRQHKAFGRGTMEFPYPLEEEERMKKEFSFVTKLGFYARVLIASIFVISIVLFLSHSTHASDLDDVEFLDIDGTNMLLYWSEEPPYKVKTQTSSDGGATWSAVNTMVSIPPGITLEDFDGIYKVGLGGHLVASFAVTYANTAYVVVIISDNYGCDWTSVVTVLSIPNAHFIGCPTLAMQYNDTSGVLSVISTIASGGKGHIYFVSSVNGGVSWNAPKKLSEVPTL